MLDAGPIGSWEEVGYELPGSKYLSHQIQPLRKYSCHFVTKVIDVFVVENIMTTV